jgi:hypothetical protein
MRYYEIYGKWFHLEYSDFFWKVVEATSPREALDRLAQSLAEDCGESDVDWLTPADEAIQTGIQDTEPSFMVWDDQVYQVRKITEVKPVEVECSHCGGTGRTTGYAPTP